MKILYVSTISDTINAFLIPHIEFLTTKGHSVDIACNVQQQIADELVDSGCMIHNISFMRSPLNRANIAAYRNLKKLILTEKYDIIHTHTPIASAIVRLVCKNIKEIRVFYTAHGFHFHKDAPIKNWILYYPLEKYLSKYTDTLITINKEDYYRAKDKFNAQNIEYLPGVGIDINKFRNPVIDKISKCKEIGIPSNSFIILSVGELNENKNHEIIIRAIATMKNPDIHYVICGTGPLDTYLSNLAFKVGIGSNLHLLGFRNDIAEIYKIANLFAFPSLREGLPVSVMEAMVVGIPIICSNIRGNKDLIINEKGGLVFNHYSIRDVSRTIERVVENENNTQIFIEYNKYKIIEYSVKSILDSLSNIYQI